MPLVDLYKRKITKISKDPHLSSMKSVKKRSRCFTLLLLLGLSLFSSVMLQVPRTQASTDKQVRQAVLLIRQSTQTQSSYMFPVTVAAAMNISYTIFNADQAALTNATLYAGQVGKFSLIAVTPGAVKDNLNATQRSLLDTYEEQFGVAEVLLGSVPSTLLARYGVSSLGATPRFTCLRWASNALTNSMNTGMYVTTLTTNTTVYAYGGNETQTNPFIWSYFSGNKIRIASSIWSLSPYIGDSFASGAAFWLGCKLSSANKILKFYWSIDIDDIDETHTDSGICGAPPVSNLYFNGSDVNHMVANFLTQSGFNPTLAVDYYDVSNLSMVTTYPALYNALMSNKDRFDFTPHSHQLGETTSYDMALSIIRGDRNALRSWGFQPTLYYMVPGRGLYTDTTAPAITDSPVWYVAQGYSATSDTVPTIKQKLSIFDVWSPTLFRVVRGWIDWMDYNFRTSQQVLNSSGHGTWNEYWGENLFSFLFNFPQIWGGYRIEMTHFQNWVYGRESADAPVLQLLRNMTGIGVVPVVPSRSWAMAETYYFMRNFKFNATYDISQNTLTYSMLKNNAAARDRITLILEGKARPVDFDPLMLKYDQNSTIVTFNYKTSITLKLGEQEITNPYVANYQTSLLTNSSLSTNALSFEISAPPETTSTTEVYAGVRGKPLQVSINGVQYSEGENWVYNSTSNFVNVTWTHSSVASIVIAWRAVFAFALESVTAWEWAESTECYASAVGDVDGDGSKEIVTGGYYSDGIHDVAQLCVWNGSNLAPEDVTAWYWTSDTYITSVAVGDVDADDSVEIVTGGYYYDGERAVAQLCVWNGSTLTLEDVTAWYWTSDTYITSVAVGDVDADDSVEVVTGGYYFDDTRDVAQLCVWSGSALALENVKIWWWMGNTSICSVAVGDVDNDGSVEVVTGGYYFDDTCDVAQLCVWSGSMLTLETLTAWYWTSNTYIESVAVGDVDADGSVEVVTGGYYYDGTRSVAQLCVWSGSTLALEDATLWYWTDDTLIQSLAVSDVDGDQSVEIVTGGRYWDGAQSVAQLCVWSGSTLTLEDVTAWYWTSDTYIESVAVGDVNADDSVEIVAGGYYLGIGDTSNAQLTVWVSS